MEEPELRIIASRHPLRQLREVAISEEKVGTNPNDVVERARLLIFYSQRKWNFHLQSVSTQIARARHILWFIDNQPDWKFCGDHYFYLPMDDPEYQNVKEHWLTKIAGSESFMRRLNAYFFLLFGKDPQADEFFDR